jgi:hypothetical protein
MISCNTRPGRCDGLELLSRRAAGLARALAPMRPVNPGLTSGLPRVSI